MGNDYSRINEVIWIDYENVKKFPYDNKILRASGSTKQEALDNLKRRCKKKGLIIPIKDKETGYYYCGQFERTKCFGPNEIWKNTVLFYKSGGTYVAQIFL